MVKRGDEIANGDPAGSRTNHHQVNSARLAVADISSSAQLFRTGK